VRRSTFGWMFLALASCLSCGGGPAVERRCGESPTKYFSAYTVKQLSAYADCTVLVGLFQEDSVSELEDFAPLKNVTKIEGRLNVFRSPGFLTLHGLENLETVEGDLDIHLNDNLLSILALGKLRTVTGNLYLLDNPRLPQSQVEWLTGRNITVGGSTTLK
jgi:Receptor L domain